MEIICPNPNCGYKGPPEKHAKGSALIFFLFLLCGIWPGILYYVFRGGYKYRCPKCGIEVYSD